MHICIDAIFIYILFSPQERTKDHEAHGAAETLLLTLSSAAASPQCLAALTRPLVPCATAVGKAGLSPAQRAVAALSCAGLEPAAQARTFTPSHLNPSPWEPICIYRERGGESERARESRPKLRQSRASRPGAHSPPERHQATYIYIYRERGEERERPLVPCATAVGKAGLLPAQRAVAALSCAGLEPAAQARTFTPSHLNPSPWEPIYIYIERGGESERERESRP